MRFANPFTVILFMLASFSAAHLGLNRKFTIPVVGDVDLTVFEHAATKSSLEYITNSGICETTPGVNQYSGYLNYGEHAKPYYHDLILKVSRSEHEHVVLVLRGPKYAQRSSSSSLPQWWSRVLFRDWHFSGKRALPFCWQ